MKYCTKCGSQVSESDKFCSDCGMSNDQSSNSDTIKADLKVELVNTSPNKDDIPFNLKNASKTFESDLINEDVSSKNHKVRQSNHIKFEIKQFIWLIILLVSMLILISKAQNIPNLNPNTTTLNFLEYALGQIAGMVVKDGLFIAVPIGIFMVASGLEKYHWYHWLNMLAYATVFARLFFGFLNTL